MTQNLKTLKKHIHVKNSLVALQQLATMHRLQLDATVFIAIGGSNGKTTTKSLLHAVFSQHYNTFATEGNLNNHIGVPLSILSVNHDCDIAICEIGANHLTEHELFCNILQPDMALITNCGKDHLQGYGSVQNVIKSNKEIFDFCVSKKAIGVFVNSDDVGSMSFQDYPNSIFFGNTNIVTLSLLMRLRNIQG